MRHVVRVSLLVAALFASTFVVAGAARADDKSSSASDPDKTVRTVEFYGGTAFSFRTNLKIEQAGQPDISLGAKYKTEPFTSPIYYAWRFGRWKGNKATEIEWIHHKLYLDNGPSEVQKFNITHGFNMFMLNKAQEKNGIVYRVGGGIVITHPENTVRDQALPEDNGIFNKGYHLSGAAAQVAVAKRFDLSNHWFANVEAKLTAAYARVDVVDGHASVPNVATHFLFGIGYKY